MKKFLPVLLICIFISSCGNQNIQNNSNTSSGKIQTQEETNSGTKQAAEDVLKEIENTSQEDISQALQEFLAQDSIDYKSEIQKTLDRYNDNYGPVLEYKHAVKPKEEEEEEEEEETSTWNIADSKINEQEEDSEENEEIQEKQNYSWEAKPDDNWDTQDDEEKQPEFTTITKTGSSWTYTSYQPNWDTCNGGLKMTDNQWDEKWLFYNTCDKIIYDFELDFGWINIFYKDEQSETWEEFVSIE